MPMHARITQFRIRTGKLEDFFAAVDSMLPLMRQQKGSVGLMVLRGDTPAAEPEVTVISAWDSLDSLRASEENLYFYRGMARMLAFSDGFPSIREQQILVSEFVPR